MHTSQTLCGGGARLKPSPQRLCNKLPTGAISLVNRRYMGSVCERRGFLFMEKNMPVRLPAKQVVRAVGDSDNSDSAIGIYDSRPLQEGVRKHRIAAFVADESGLINRVAGVFARRNANIESLAVGLTTDKALFSIVATGTDSVVSNLCRQLTKLVNVRFVEDITDSDFIEKELMLVKLRAPPGPARTEITQLAEIFRANIVDVGESTFTLCVAGDTGKVTAFVKVMSKFGMIQIVRTGRLAMKRGGQLFGGRATYEAIAPDAQDTEKSDGVPSDMQLPTPHVSQKSDVYAASFDDEGRLINVFRVTYPAYEFLSESCPVPARIFKRYDEHIQEQEVVISQCNAGVWNVKNVLDASYTKSITKIYQACTISVDVEDVPGVLNQVTGVISRRGYNVQSLAVGNSEQPGMSRITMVIPADKEEIGKLVKQLLKLVYVKDVAELHKIPHVARELMLIKVVCLPSQRGEINDISKIFNASICDLSRNTATIMVIGKESKMKAFKEVLEPYRILEIARTGRIALSRESGIDSRYLSSVTGGRVML